ncbi:MAG: YolD-like family protein [Lysinibacillus sp.]
MLRDRGNIKWTAMMLPEHVQLLRRWEQDEATELPKEKTEWELEELQQTIQQAVVTKRPVMLKLWLNEVWRSEIGVITATDSTRRQLLLETAVSIKRIELHTIHTAQFVAEDYD